MRLKPDQLYAALQKPLLPVYLLSGDEPLQLSEAADAVRAAARGQDYCAREVVSVEQGNEWVLLSEEANALSIFGDKKMIDLRLPSAKPGNDGSKALLEYCQNPPADTVLLITTAKLDVASQKTQWFQAIDKIGAVLQVWPLQGQELLHWLRKRAESKGMAFEQGADAYLASRIEGNLLAAAQEIEKLFILLGPVRVSRSMIESAVADSARFDVYQLADALLGGKLNRAVRILNGLKAEGIAAPVVVWALSREARLVFNVKTELKLGGVADAVLKKHHVWDKRKALVQDAVRRLSFSCLESILLASAQADGQIKGQLPGDGWNTLFEISLLFCRTTTPAR
jgi:DNA polymerase-3 subunit delta